MSGGTCMAESVKDDNLENAGSNLRVEPDQSLSTETFVSLASINCSVFIDAEHTVISSLQETQG